MRWIRTDRHTQIEGPDDIHLVHCRRTEDFDRGHCHLFKVQGAVRDLEDHVYGRDGLLKSTLRQFLEETLLKFLKPRAERLHHQEATHGVKKRVANCCHIWKGKTAARLRAKRPQDHLYDLASNASSFRIALNHAVLSSAVPASRKRPGIP